MEYSKKPEGGGVGVISEEEDEKLETEKKDELYEDELEKRIKKYEEFLENLPPGENHDIVENMLADLKNQKELATIDALTGLPNRLSYKKKFAKTISKSKEIRGRKEPIIEQRKMTNEDKWKEVIVAVIDIDFFKKVNDNYGHLIGDKVLEKLGVILEDNFRSDTDSVYRIGGEEFVITAVGINPENAQKKLDKVREIIEKTKIDIGNNKKINITVSIGFSELRDNDDPEKIFKRADGAVYASKKEGRNRVKMFDDSMELDKE